MRAIYVDDGELGFRTAKLRSFVLHLLLDMPVDRRGSGKPLSGDQLVREWRLNWPEDEVDEADLSNAARHLARVGKADDPNLERVLWWRRSTRSAHFGVSRDCRPAAERLASAYAERVTQLTPDPGIREPPAGPTEQVGGAFSLERVDGEAVLVHRGAIQVRSGNVGLDNPAYDVRKVEWFIDRLPGLTNPQFLEVVTIAYAVVWGGDARRRVSTEAGGPYVAEMTRDFFALSEWERANVLYRLAPLVERVVSKLAQAVYRAARSAA